MFIDKLLDKDLCAVRRKASDATIDKKNETR